MGRIWAPTRVWVMTYSGFQQNPALPVKVCFGSQWSGLECINKFKRLIEQKYPETRWEEEWIGDTFLVKSTTHYGIYAQLDRMKFVEGGCVLSDGVMMAPEANKLV